MRRIEWAIVVLLAAAAVTLLYAGAALPAPAPLPRPVKARPAKPLVMASELAGEWTMRWDGAGCPTMLYQDGSYTCLHSGRPWAGRWRLEDGNRLVIEEAPDGSEVLSHRWEAVLRRAPGGYSATGGPVLDLCLYRPPHFSRGK